MSQNKATGSTVEGLGMAIGVPAARLEEPNLIVRLKSSPPSGTALDEL